MAGRKPEVRPTTQKVLEALLTILEADLDGARVLDLFAGTGSFGFGALRLGARELVLVEAHPAVARALRGKGGQVVQGRLPQALERLTGSFEVIFADPPYGDPAGPLTLAGLGGLASGRVIFEHHHKDSYPDALPGLTLEQRRRYGETAISFYRA